MGEGITIEWILGGVSESSSSEDLRAEDILGPQELARWKAMRFEKRRADFLLGRYTAKRLLTSTGMPWEKADLSSLEILNEPEGAPYLGDPENQNSLSISHRAGTAAAAFCALDGAEVGIDLELIEPREWSFVEDFFSADEMAYVKDAPETVQPLLVTLVWSAKEAVLKAWRKGLRVDTRTIGIQPLSDEDIGSLAKEWVEIGTQVRGGSFPPCRLYGRVIEEMVLTLAISHLPPGQSSARIELVQMNG